MGHMLGGSSQGRAKAALLAFVLCVSLAGAALGAAGRLPAGVVSEAVAIAASTTASTLAPAANGPHRSHASRQARAGALWRHWGD
jgi:hypothetical protein